MGKVKIKMDLKYFYISDRQKKADTFIRKHRLF
jgi:hypothetical protein